jgi:anti-sigma factor RsiW
MQGASPEIHPAATAWVDGTMTPAQRQEFETHLAGCANCQAEVAALLQQRLPPAGSAAPPVKAARGRSRARPVLIGVAIAVLILVVGYALGWWAWQLAHR